AEVLARMSHCATFGELWDWALAHSPALAVHSVPLSDALRVLPGLIRLNAAIQWRANAAA
ncbi:hypothetical protein, partial [Hymenobacter agri]